MNFLVKTVYMLEDRQFHFTYIFITADTKEQALIEAKNELWHRHRQEGWVYHELEYCEPRAEPKFI